jgi:hypothetical protein
MMGQNQNRERMLNKLSKRKETKESSEHLHQTNVPNEFVFSMNDGEKQEKSTKPACEEKSVDDWLCEIESTGEKKPDPAKPKTSKKSKKKK